MPTTITVPYEIACMSDTCGIKESNPPGQPTATVTFTCASVDHYQLIRDIIGYPIAVSSVEIFRTYPFQYPPSPNLIAVAIESVEFYGAWVPIPGVGLPWLWRKRCKVTCRFELPTWFISGVGDPSGLPYTTTTFQGQPEVLTLPNTAYFFPSGQSTTVNVGLKFGKMAISMLRHMCPFMPVPQCFPLLGTLNNAAITLAGFPCAIGTLYYAGFSASPLADPSGLIYYDVQHSFEYRPRDWNQMLSPVPGEGWQVVTDSGSNPPMAYADFSTIP